MFLFSHVNTRMSTAPYDLANFNQKNQMIPVTYPAPMTGDQRIQPNTNLPYRSRARREKVERALRKIRAKANNVPTETDSEHEDSEHESESGEEEEGEESDIDEKVPVHVKPISEVTGPEIKKLLKTARIHATVNLDKRDGKQNLKAEFPITPRCIMMALGMPDLMKTTGWGVKIHNIVPVQASGVRELLKPIYICMKKDNQRIAEWNDIYSAHKKKHYMAIISTDSTGASLSRAGDFPVDSVVFNALENQSLDTQCMRIIATTDCKDITNEVLPPYQLPVIADICFELTAEITY